MRRIGEGWKWGPSEKLSKQDFGEPSRSGGNDERNVTLCKLVINIEIRPNFEPLLCRVAFAHLSLRVQETEEEEETEDGLEGQEDQQQ